MYRHLCGRRDHLGRHSGLDALYASPLLPENGTFDFTQRPVAGQPLGPYDHLTTDWARVSDEWEQVCAVIGSPSHWFHGDLFPFAGGLKAQDRYEWYRLRLQPAGKRARVDPVARQLNGRNTLGEAVMSGLRTTCVTICWPNCGWVLRDLIWEQKYSPVAAASVPPLAGLRLSG